MNSIVYTNTQCQGCNRCISACPMLTANWSVDDENGKQRIEVHGEYCVQCGACLHTCEHNARSYQDDTEKFFGDLKNGEQISVLIAPSFAANYPDEYGKILGGLKKLGVNRFINVSFGADITTWAYINYVSQSTERGFISQPCPSVVNYIERYTPELIPKLIPVQSPLMCSAIYAKKYVNITDKLAFIGPCIAKKMETDDPNTFGYVNYNLTYNHLMEYVRGNDVYGEEMTDEIEYGLGSVYPMPGGLKENVRWFCGEDIFVRQVEGTKRAYKFLDEYKNRVNAGKELPFMVDILNCDDGCIYGSGVEAEKAASSDAYYNLHRIKERSKHERKNNPFSKDASPEQRLKMLNELFSALSPEDFARSYTNKSATISVRLPNDDELEEIFESMNKHTPQERNINCGACGYSNCREMAKAIFNKSNTPKNCVYYMRSEIVLLTEEAERADAASHAKDNFLANMSHEIRTPMNAVIGMTELILREDDISDTVRDYCRQIKNSGKNLISIINDILDFSKVESGKMELIEDHFSLTSTLNDITNMALVRIGEKPLEFIADIDPKIPQGLIGDEIRLRQIIINIVTNAIKYSRMGCVVLKVSLERDENGAPVKPAENEIVLSVEVIDTGIGIAEKDMSKLFDSFQQVDTKKNRAIEGTGLGLAISKRLIELMDGELSVKSVYGKGSDFSFKVPLKFYDETPFLQVKDAWSVHAAIYTDLDQYVREETKEHLRRNYEGLGAALGVDLECYYSVDELKKRMEEKKFTHIITDSDDYRANETFFKGLSDLIIVQKRDDVFPDMSGVKRVYEPFSALSFTSALNSESFTDSGESKTSSKFIAPDAHILIVDDNFVNLQVAQWLMKPYKMQVETASSGPEAIKKLRENKNYDIVFMDHMMPGMDGVEATKLIRELPGEYFKNVAIIALTANAVLGARDMFISAGMNGFLAKPLEVSSLHGILKTFLPESRINKNAAPDESDEPAAEQAPEGSDEFDPRSGLFYAGNSLEAYHSVLKVYIDKGKSKLNTIRELYERKDWENYVIEVHALKSTSLTIGAKTLSELAKELEFAGKDGDAAKIAAKTDELLALYEKVLGIAEKYLAENTKSEEALTTEALPEATVGQVKEWAEKMLAACDNMSISEIKEVCGEAAGYSFNDKAIKTTLDKVLSSAEEFEFDDAAEMIRSLTSAL